MSYFRQGLGIVPLAPLAPVTPLTLTSTLYAGTAPRLIASTPQTAPVPYSPTSGMLLVAPTRQVVSTYTDPIAPTRATTSTWSVPVNRATALVSNPGAGVTEAGLVEGTPPASSTPINVAPVGYSAAWTPGGPTLRTAQAKADAARDAADEAALQAMMIEKGLKSKPNYLLYGGIAAVIAVGAWWYLRRNR